MGNTNNKIYSKETIMVDNTPLLDSQSKDIENKNKSLEYYRDIIVTQSNNTDYQTHYINMKDDSQKKNYGSI